MSEYSQQKAALTRAQKKGYAAVIEACKKFIEQWEGSAWPDDWHRWERALEDSYWQARRNDEEVPSRPVSLDDLRWQV